MTVKREEKAILTKKRFVGWIILNYRTGGMRVVKKDPKRVNPIDIPVKVDIIVNVPKRQAITAKGEITISSAKVKEMFIESL